MIDTVPIEPTTAADRAALARRFSALRSADTAGLSSGEQLVAAALRDPDAITAEVCTAVASAVWGVAAAEADAAAGYPRTWAWLADVARG